MDTSLPDLKDIICKEATMHSQDGKTIPLRSLRKILADCKQLCLTAFQLAVLLGFTNPDRSTPEMMVEVEAFAVVLVEKIELMYSMDAIRRKAQLCHLGHFKVSHIKMPEYDENALFKEFRKYD